MIKFTSIFNMFKQHFLKIKEQVTRLHGLGKHKVTIMVIPNSERSIRNIHISYIYLSLFGTLFSVGLVIAMFMLISVTIKSKEMYRLEKWAAVNRAGLNYFQTEIDLYNKRLTEFKKEVTNFITTSSRANKRVYGIGGNEIDLDQLSDSLKTYLLIQEQANVEIPSENLETGAEFIGHSSVVSRKLNLYIQKRRRFLTSFPNLWPVQKGISTCQRRGNEKNKAITIYSFPGSPVLASAQGHIVWLRQDEKSTYTVVLDHGYGFYSRYEGISGVRGQIGTLLKKGSQLGNSTGSFTYKVRIATTYLDPLKYSHSRFYN
jgi:murein DD-endopeptidase MepM/ murein hydrolase activator NlpD